jgi:hypothetical protein
MREQEDNGLAIFSLFVEKLDNITLSRNISPLKKSDLGGLLAQPPVAKNRGRVSGPSIIKPAR